MTLTQINEVLNGEVLTGGKALSKEVTTVICSDLMSDVLAFSRTDCLLLTGLINPQTVRTAEMSELAAVCYVRGKRPTTETVQLASRNEIPLLATDYSLYEAAGRLFQAGLGGCDSL
jgi:predicted transcriptional regulator